MPAAGVHLVPTARARYPTGPRGSSRAGDPRATVLPARRVRRDREARVHPDHVRPTRLVAPAQVGRMRLAHLVRPGRVRRAPVRPDRVGPVRPGHVLRVRRAADRRGRPVHAAPVPAVPILDRRLRGRLPPQLPLRQGRRRRLARRPLVSVSRSIPSPQGGPSDVSRHRVLRLNSFYIDPLSTESVSQS